MPGHCGTRRLFWIASACVGASAIALVAGLIVWPLAEPAPATGIRSEVHQATVPAARKAIQLSDFASLLNKRLQRPLEDPPPPTAPRSPPPVVAVAQPQVPLPELRLLGTAKDSDQRHSMAWLQSPGKPAMLVGLGETLKTIPGEPVVEKIEPGSATLKFGERELMLQLKRGPNAK